MVSLRALECLVTIIEQGSVTKAAAVLHMSQPALSHQIAAVERELGTPVIERLARGTRPTAAGLAAAAEARIALAAADRAVLAARRVAAGTGGRIRIACAETMTAWVLVPVLRSWRRRFPDVEFGLKEFTSADQMLEVLLRGETDIAVGPRPTRTDEHVELLGREETVVVAAPDHRFAALEAVPSPSWPPNRSFTTTRVTASGCGSTSSPHGAVSCWRRRRCAPAARAPPRSWPWPEWGWRSCPPPP
jgi:DNA-binding transcriptional LysR family regulator